MPSLPSSATTPPLDFTQNFLAPMLLARSRSSHARACPELSDERWWQLGLRRALEDHPSGRAFLQHLSASGLDAPDTGHFFETLKSTRRLRLIAEVSHALARQLPALDPALWAGLPELEGFELYAGDGHFHGAAAHDRRDVSDGVKYAVGHFFALNLRTHGLSHLAVADQIERKKEHDMRALKAMSLEALRQGVPAGCKVLYVWDRAGIDFRQWPHWKHTGGLYFVSREPSGAR